MSFKVQDFLHAPQVPEMASAAYFKLVEAYTPAHNPANSFVRTIEQLAKGLVFDLLTHQGDTEDGVYNDLAKAGMVGISPSIPYKFCFLSPSTKTASFTGSYHPAVQNILPQGIHEATSAFHQRMRFDVNFINQNTIKQVVLVDLGIPYVPGLNLEDTISLFKDAFAVLVQYQELSDLYNKYGYAGSQVITSTTTTSAHTWYCSLKLMLILNSFDGDQTNESAQEAAQNFADEFTNMWINAIAHVANITKQEDLNALADNVASNYVSFVFHANEQNIEEVTPDVNTQMLFMEEYLEKNESAIRNLNGKDIVNNCLQMPGALPLTPSMLLRLTCVEGIHPEVHKWCIARWLEYCRNFAGTLSCFLADHYYQDVLEYNPEDCNGQISLARQDYFFNLNKTNDNELIFKIPTNLTYTTINPLLLENTLLLLAEAQPRALNFMLQLLLDLHNHAFSRLINQEELARNGVVGLYLPVEWLLLCADISEHFNELGLLLSLQEDFDVENDRVLEILESIEDHINNWLSQDFYRSLIIAGRAYLSPRRLTLARTWVEYKPYAYDSDILVSEAEAGRPSALLIANVMSEAFEYPSVEDMEAIYNEQFRGVSTAAELPPVNVLLESPVSPVQDVLYAPFELEVLRRMNEKLFAYTEEQREKIAKEATQDK